jgi:flagellar motor switch protein FliN/FliY
MTQAPVAEIMSPVRPSAETPPPQAAQPQPDHAVEVHEARLPEAVDTGARAPGGKMDILLDTAIDVTARLGEARMPARELLQLGPGAVVTLDRQAGEPVDLILNGVRFATGHLVLVGDQLGIRIKEILACPTAEAAT